MTKDLLALLDWLKQAQVTHVAMESTGVFWKPIYNILEGHFEVWGSQCTPPPESPGTQDRCERCAVDCSAAAMRVAQA
jgi:hypothetical protein